MALTAAKFAVVPMAQLWNRRRQEIGVNNDMGVVLANLVEPMVRVHMESGEKQRRR